MLVGLLLTVTCKKDEEKIIPEESGMIAVNDCKLYYKLAGAGTPIIFISPAYCSTNIWKAQYEFFKQNHQVLLFDIRSTGGSDYPYSDAVYSEYSDLKALMDSLGIERAHICGSVYGAGIATDFVLTYPHRVLSHISCPARIFNFPNTGDYFNMVKEYKTLFVEGRYEEACSAFVYGSYSEDAFPYGEAAKTVYDELYANAMKYKTWSDSTGKTVFDLPYPTRARDNEAEYISAIQEITNFPSLVVNSETQMSFFEDNSKIMTDNISDIETVTISDAALFMYIDNPDEFNEKVLEFIDKVDAE